MVQLIQFEQEATAIRYYGSVILPGLLQTPAYAEAILRTFEFDEAKVATIINSRQRRRTQLLYRPDPPDYLLILDESVLRREVGGPAVMGEQLQLLLRLIQETRMLVRVVPFEGPVTIAILGPFALLDLGAEQNAMLYRESHLIDEIVHSPRNLKRHREGFEDLWNAALDDANSAQLIQERAAAMIAKASVR